MKYRIVSLTFERESGLHHTVLFDDMDWNTDDVEAVKERLSKVTGAMVYATYIEKND